ncbi:TPA: site-specific DNA-methyltransferase [Enterococcus faecalis]|nr:site-specific DNA-methyltransferase [Enterococcus faecalis]HBI1740250.1 site-specific DNA-methyltransferase [Enterococcus faecalis]HBI1743109.1 site-specific DNA-methyltransferase [Enterococcus faecalis]HBI1745908.1 site-specific DNA-methyltransferase [Enterococcus faecalis]HBI1749237.1 site-specific DNA-methyltransferase [Enterococcus faecalis]
MDTRLMQQIKDILKEFPQYWNGEELQRPIVIDDLKNYDALLISALLKNQKIRENYSVKAGDVVIFKVQEFIDILRYKDYWADSYTKYSNTIGLSSEGKYLQYNTDVVLDFPYKDCILEGGMTKEDTGKEEVFYNEVIARDEIDTLLAPKALVNAKKYDVDGEHKVDSFSNEDNLIIKGNNLLALHSLKERYAGKVKCIYIDPPYNTGNDSFKYNDRFNHSTWLTFMRNRLEIAKELLSDDGSIWINIDDDESHYLKVLADSVFKRENFISNIIWQKKYAATNDTRYLADMHDHILLYSKYKQKWKPELLPRPDKLNEKYKNPDNDSRGPWYATNLSVKTFSQKNYYEIISPAGISFFPPPSRCWVVSKEKYQELLKDNRITFGKDGKSRPYQKKFLSEVQNGVVPETLWLHSEVGHTIGAKKHIRELFHDSLELFATPKPEKLIERIITVGTNENDIVLDFFMGSATTQAVAMKMNRRFIGIEQMDYINTVSVPRLQKVIEGEQGGISKDVNWQGGGSFIYAELMELNQLYMNKIDQASTKEELADLWDELDNNADLNFQLDKEKLTNELLKEHDEEEGSITFNDLTFDEQKEIFKKALDKNQLYVPYSEIEDKNVIISDDDKAFNHSFYNNEGE